MFSRRSNGNEISISSDAILSTAQKALKEAGYVAIFGLEIEFQIFRRLMSLSHDKATMPATPLKLKTPHKVINTLRSKIFRS